MSEEASINDASSIRPRRACINCYEKKIKCDYDPELGTCNPCKKNGLECAVPSGDVPKPRKSIRATVEDLESRVQSLEGHQGPWSAISGMPQSGFMSLASTSPRLPAESNENIAATASSSDAVSVPLTRGATSPWSILLSGTDGSNPDFRSFHASATASAESESSITMSKNTIPYNMFSEIPGLGASQINDSTRNYACIAPYPILNWESLQETIRSLVEWKRMMRTGQGACVWVYMAFGAAHSGETRAETVTNNEPGLYFQRAWALLPQLLLDYDLWALKAVTLMVHYLQASAKPQACWALLGTALRLAISLGFDRDDSNLRIYSKIEREEGRRAFWLCYIMEKSLCINLGHSSSFTVTPQVPTPLPFESETMNVDNDILGENERDAATFFRQIIELTEVRDEMFAALQSGHRIADDSYQHLVSRLQTNRRSGGSKPDSTTGIRDCIHDLAYNNTLQILATTQMQARWGQISEEAVISARQSLDLVSESQKSGQLMCLWMWLYYAFTSAVILFLHSIANPLDRETTLNLAAISDLENICSGLAGISEGATRCMEIAKAMRAVIHKTVKIAGRKRSREAEDTGGESSKSKRRMEPGTTAALAAADLDPDPGSWQQSIAADPDAMLAGAPTNFAWDEWDKWLEDVDFTGGYGP